MVIRAGFGLFADLAPGFLIGNLNNNAPYPYGALIYNGDEVGNTSDPGSAATGAFESVQCLQDRILQRRTLAQLNAEVPGGFGPVGYFSIPQHFSTPEYAEWGCEIEQPIGEKNVAGAKWVRRGRGPQSGNHFFGTAHQRTRSPLFFNHGDR